MCPDVKNCKWRLNPVWHRILYSCTHHGNSGRQRVEHTAVDGKFYSASTASQCICCALMSFDKCRLLPRTVPQIQLQDNPAVVERRRTKPLSPYDAALAVCRRHILFRRRRRRRWHCRGARRRRQARALYWRCAWERARLGSHGSHEIPMGIGIKTWA